MQQSATHINSIVVSKLPDAGLGNKLFTWAHGLIFAQKNKLTHKSCGFTKIKIGPLLRGEKSLRFYNNYFKQSAIIYKSVLYLLSKFKKIEKIDYKDCNSQILVKNKTIYLFNQIPHWSDFFLHIRENRSIVINNFFDSLNTTIYKKYQLKDSPAIGVHIRMGDFKKLQENTDFSSVGHTRTPLQYFIDCITLVRSVTSKKLPITIFSDGKEDELKEVLALPDTKLADDDSDILQMLHLSKSKLIILSAGSTFGQWAAFLSEAAVINHYQHFSNYIRPKDFNEKHFEGIINFSEPLPTQLTKNILEI